MHLKSWRTNMTRENAKALLPIIKAYAEGKVIQIINPSGEWIDNNEPLFNCDYSFYRIKQKVKFRPFANAEECWAEMQKHQPFGWLKDKSSNKLIIENVDSRGCVEVYNGGACSFNEVFEYFTFADGLPFGIKEEE